MRFRTKDLMITVVPRVEVGINPDLKLVCLLETRICVAVSYWLTTCPRASQYQFGPCTDCPRTTVPTLCTDANVTLEPLMLNDRQDLAVLRVELKETLKQLDEIEGKLPSGFGDKEKAKEMADALEGVVKQIRKASTGRP